MRTLAKLFQLGWTRLLESTASLVYPQSCLHCHSLDINTKEPLCHPCLQMLVMTPPLGRCPGCFALVESQSLCHQCLKQPGALLAMAAAFEYGGPAATLIKGLKYGSLDYLAKGMGAFMATQYLALDWPWPDYLIPVPLSAMHLLERGYNQSALLAASLGSVLQCPVLEILGRYSGDYSQAGLARRQRLTLRSERFVLRPECQVELRGKTLLLVDDVITTGTTLTCCAEVLKLQQPAHIYGIAFGRAVE